MMASEMFVRRNEYFICESNVEDVRAAEPTYKPNSVPALKFSAGGDHSSGRRIAAPLLRPTRKRPALRAHLKFWIPGLNRPFEIRAQRVVSRISSIPLPYLALHRRGFA